MTDSIERKLLLVGKGTGRYPLRRISAEARRLGLSPILTHYSAIDIYLHERVEVLIEGNDLIHQIRAAILDGPGPYTVLRNLLVSHLTSLGIYVLNGNSFLTWPSLNKLTQTYQLNKSGISVIPTRLFGNEYRLIASTTDLSLPLIAKAVDGSGGKGTWEVATKDDILRGPLRYHSPYHMLIQPKVNAQSEYRIVVLGEHVLGAVLKIPAPGEFRANREQGATFENTTLPHLVKAVSLRCCKILKCDFAGVDILYTKDGSTEKYWVLEVNRFLGYEGFEQATHINVSLDLLNWISDRLQHN